MQEVTVMRVAKPIELNVDDDRRLRILSKGKRVEARLQLRARIVLLAAGGTSDKDIAAKLDIDRRVAARWRARYLGVGIDGLVRDAKPWATAHGTSRRQRAGSCSHDFGGDS